jgi:hypothetical protein
LALSIGVFVTHFFVADAAAKERAAWIFAVGLVLYAVFRFKQRPAIARVP